MWIAGVMQGLMWRATNPDGTLTYTFLESVVQTHPYYVARLFGGLLVLFGGGCTLILGVAFASDPMSLFNDMPLFLSIWLPLGLAPLAVGYWLLRRGRSLNNRTTQREGQAVDKRDDGIDS